MAGRNDERLSPRASGGSGAPSFADSSSFREMIREEREAARAEREAAAAEARVERETAAAEQRRLMAEVYELKLQLAEERRTQTAAVQNRTTIGLDGRRHIEPMRWMGSESAPSPTRSQASTSSRNGDSGAVPIQRGNGESQVKQIKDVPMFDGTKANFLTWKQNFLCLAKHHGLVGIFTEGVDVPVADETMSIAALQEVFPHENIQKHFIAWKILSRAIVSNGDRDTLRHASSPAAGWRAPVDTYSASTLGAKVQCLQSRTPRRVKPGANPIPVFVAMIKDVRNMRANGSDIEDEVVCLLFLRALPDGYNVFREMLEREREKLTIERLRTELRTRYDLLKEGKPSKTSDTAFLASGTKRGNIGRRREKCGKVSGNKQEDGGATRKGSNGQGSSSGAGGSNGAPSGKQGGPTRCNICKETGHKWFKCPKRICSVCRETGHDLNSCPQVVKEDANLAISDGDRLSTGDKLDGMCEYLPSQYVRTPSSPSLEASCLTQVRE